MYNQGFTVAWHFVLHFHVTFLLILAEVSGHLFHGGWRGLLTIWLKCIHIQWLEVYVKGALNLICVALLYLRTIFTACA